MATYYKFKEREDPTKSMIDWAGITKTLSDGITAESTRRTDLKGELENDYIAQLNALDEVTQGSNQSFNQAMLGFSHNYKDYLMNNHNMMKRGIISVNDSKMAKQGAKDSFTNLNNVAKNFDAQLQAIIDKGGNANDWLSEQAVNFIDVKNQQLLIDPTTGTASFGRFMEDGKTIDKATITPIGSMGQKFKPFERFDNDQEIADAVKGFSSIYKIADGAYKSVSDIMQKPGVSEAIDKRIEAMIAGGKDISAAVDFLDMKLTNDETLKDNPDYIFVENAADGTMFKPKLSEEQTKKLKAALKAQVVMGLGVEITQTEPRPPTSSELTGTQNKNSYNLIKGFLGGNEQDFRALARQQGLKVATTKNGQLVIENSEGRQVPINLTGSVTDVGAEIAAALGFDPEDFKRQIKSTNATSVEKFVGFKGYNLPSSIVNTTENIQVLQSQLQDGVADEMGNVTAIAPAVKAKRVLQKVIALAGPRKLKSTDFVLKKIDATETTEEGYIIMYKDKELGSFEDSSGILEKIDILTAPDSNIYG